MRVPFFGGVQGKPRFPQFPYPCFGPFLKGNQPLPHIWGSPNKNDTPQLGGLQFTPALATRRDVSDFGKCSFTSPKPWGIVGSMRKPIRQVQRLRFPNPIPPMWFRARSFKALEFGCGGSQFPSRIKGSNLHTIKSPPNKGHLSQAKTKKKIPNKVAFASRGLSGLLAC